MHAAKQKRFTLLARQQVDDSLQPPQFVSGGQHPLITDSPAQLVQIGHIVEGDDRCPARLIDQQIARDTGEEGRCLLHIPPIFDSICARQRFRDYVVQINA